MKSAEIRNRFLEYFQRNDHTLVSSSSLVPQKDPSLLFTNAGMVQFKSVFLGEENRGYRRATTSQKCVRAGGKHNDLENVGRTARHHTFFEMLGNFSFGDYFKEAAIAYSWEFLTKEMNLDSANLWVTVYKDDDEAFDIWKNKVGVSPDRIVRLGEKDNFWAMGETGPCGPCSEIIIDQGPEMSCGQPDCKVGCDCDRYLELWNLVFMQYNRDEAGKMTPLPKPSIDTGLGLERLASVIQGVKTNYDTDLLRGIIAYTEELSQSEYNRDPDDDVSFRVIADHCRAMTFLIGDGVLPSNEGRGYVLRRIMRRAARHAKLLGFNEPVLYKICGMVIDIMRDAYPDLNERRSLIAKVAQAEEERFLVTLESGMKILSEEVDMLKTRNLSTISGDTVFKLYDTYGFPVDLTEDIVRQDGFDLDTEGFNRLMEEQRERARQAWKGSGDDAVDGVYLGVAANGISVEFVGYDSLEAMSQIQAIIREGKPVDKAEQGDIVEVICGVTPFYGESGGQIGDSGVIFADGLEIEVSKSSKPLPDLIVHEGKIKSGTLVKGAEVNLRVDPKRRSSTAGNHTATHLLQAALRQVLGSHVNQSGSLVTPERLRFDFTHFSGIEPRELLLVEEIVNDRIRQNIPLAVKLTSMEEASSEGAMALFDEKYGDVVRMVSIGDFSKELCGGTHVERTGDIGFFKLLSESSVAAGVRRVEAITGHAAVSKVQEEAAILQNIAAELRSQPGEVPERIEKLRSRLKSLEKEVENLKIKAASRKSGDLTDNVREIKGIPVLSLEVDVDNPKSLRELGDDLKGRMKSGIIVLGANVSKKALILVIVSKDLAGKYHAGEIVKELATEVGGSGGGRPDMAQAGGPQADRLKNALEKVFDLI